MRFLNDNLYQLFAALVLAIGTWCWFAVPEPAAPRTLVTAPEPWRLPDLAASDSARAIQSLTARNLWGVPAAVAANAPPPPPKWTVMGIARQGAERFVLLAFEAQPVRILKVGDALPDGLKIAEIGDDKFFVITADKKKVAFEKNKNEPTK